MSDKNKKSDVGYSFGSITKVKLDINEEFIGGELTITAKEAALEHSL